MQIANAFRVHDPFGGESNSAGGVGGGARASIAFSELLTFWHYRLCALISYFTARCCRKIATPSKFVQFCGTARSRTARASPLLILCTLNSMSIQEWASSAAPYNLVHVWWNKKENAFNIHACKTCSSTWERRISNAAKEGLKIMWIGAECARAFAIESEQATGW